MRCISGFFVDSLIEKLKKGRWTLLKYPLSKQHIQKNVFGGHFPTEHNGVTDYIVQIHGQVYLRFSSDF